MRNLLTASALFALTLSVTACGNDRASVPDLSALGKPSKVAEYKSGDGSLRFRFPISWAITNGKAPLVATLGSGSALAAVYAYPRTDLGTGAAAVEASRKRVIASLEERAPGFLLQSSKVTEVDGSPAVEIVGRGLVGDTVVRSRSIHIYKPDTEWVIDAYATPGKYAAANRIAFDRLVRTVVLADRVKTAGDTGA